MSQKRKTVTRDYRLKQTAFKRYFIVGRKRPETKDEVTPLYKMTIFARNEIEAKSRFWYFIRRIKSVKKTAGEIVCVRRIYETSPLTVKNFGIWLRYNSVRGIHNMYKEFRDTTLEGAVQQMYSEMAGKHGANFRAIQIIKTTVLAEGKATKPVTTIFSDPAVKFPLPRRKPMIRRADRKTFVLRRPTTIGW